MEPESTNSTLLAVLTGAAIPLVGWVVFHFFASHRDKKGRVAAASADFRSSVLQYTKDVPDPDKHWPNHVLSNLKKQKTELNTACQIFGYFLPRGKRRKFEASASCLSKLVSTDLPAPKTEQNLAASGGVAVPEELKSKFFKLRNDLLSYANST